jgi:colanic acid biosynthesis glycosyl transferase WcaI
MNILFLSSAYGKGGAATNQHWTELCEHFAGAHSVTVFKAGWNASPKEWREESGVRICCVGGSMLPKIKNRHIWGAALWLMMCAKVCLAGGKFDLVICVDSPRFSAVLGWLAKRRNSCKLLAWVMDLPLEQVVRREKNIGSLRSSMARAFNRLYYSTLKLCDRVVVLGDCMRKVMKKHGVCHTNVIGPWAAHPQTLLEITPALARNQNGYPEKFTISYRGYAGDWHDFDAILEAIPRLTANSAVQFHFAGVGPGIDRVAAEKEINGWESVIIQGWVPRGELGSLPLCADLHLVSLKQKMLGTCVPSKTCGAIAYGRPVIFLGPKECQAAMDIIEADAGCVVQTADELVAAIESFLENPQMLAQSSHNARKAFLEKHQASAVFKKWDDLIKEVMKS